MRSIIGISAGDPAGIGLEVTLKALPAVLGSAQWVLFSGAEMFERNYRLFGRSLPYRRVSRLSDITDERILFVIDVPGAVSSIAWGESSAEAGRRSIACLQAASDAASAGEIDALVTAPVNKASIGGAFVGQTEFLAERAHAAEFAMAFFTPTFKVVLATVHMSLQNAIAQISSDRYVRLIQLVSREFERFGFAKPRIAVAGVNPHAGEQGMFGREELDSLTPAVNRCVAMGISVSGPHPADSLYYRAHSGEFDVVIAPYHDQGLVPVKLVAHATSVNVTLGLPYVRTSPDHGTAFAIAGRGVAESAGMEAAMQCAVDLSSRLLGRKR